MRTNLQENERQENEPGSPLETIERALISAHDVTSEDAERATEWLAELMRRDWAVRVLDAWASLPRPHAGWQWQVSDRGAPGEPERFECELRTVDLTRDDDGPVFPAATPDEARAKAAAWVREQAKGTKP